MLYNIVLASFKSILMKKNYLIAFLFLIGFHIQLSACDICGCGIGGTYFGILPQYHKHFFGLNYTYQSFKSEHPVYDIEDNKYSSERFQTLEIRGRYHITKKVQLFVFVPLGFHEQIDHGLKSFVSGIGDVSTIANVTLYNSGDSLNKTWKNNLQVGGGIKWPTGTYNELNSEQQLNPNLQLGTGSTDIILDFIHTIRHRKVGLNTNILYQFNNVNSNHFKFGNKCSVNTNFFYWKTIQSYSLLPSIGIHYENNQYNKHYKTVLNTSGGQSLQTSLGIDLYLRRVSIGVNTQVPIYQSNHLIDNNFKHNIHLLYNF